MRILIANPYFAPAWGYGGPTRLLYELAQRLTRGGHTVTVLTSNSADNLGRYAPGDYREEGIRVIRLPILNQRLTFQYKQFIVPAYISQLKELLPGHDVLHLCGSRDFFVTIGARLAMNQHKPYILAAYGCLPSSGNGWKAIAKPAYDAVFTKQTVQRAARCLAQTQHENSLYQQFGAVQERIQLMPLASDGERFRRLPERGGFRQHLGLSDRERIILFVGRINPLKGLDVLVRSFANVLEHNSLARLVVVGRDDGDENTIRRLVSQMGLTEKVFFAGPLYDHDVISAYVDADAFALTPRHYEETTLAGLEACFCGTQAIVTEQAEIPYLETCGAGEVVKNDVDMIARTLVAAISDDTTIRKRGMAARSMAYRYFDWSIIAPLHAEVYRLACSDESRLGSHSNCRV